MRCVIEGNGVKVFGKTVHALSRIGEEMWLDPLEKGLAVRTVNKAHSAYACFLFSPLFFQHYTSTSDQLQDNKSAKCKISLKSVLPLFRSITTLERSVYRCEITINIFDSRVVFQFKCRNGITKTHNLGYQECEALQAVFPAHLCPNVLKAHPKLLSDIVMHFPVSQEEITLSMSPIRVILKNYFEEDNDRIMCTEMFLHPDEFDYFHLRVDSDITFCLKELRGLLTFAESHGLQVSVQFGSPGNPVSFSLEDMLLEAVVVLATLVDPATENPSQVSVAQEAPTHSVVGVSIHECPVEAEATNIVPHRPDHPVGEQVASSQGSPFFRPAFHMRKLMQLVGGGENFSKYKAPLNGTSSGSALTTTVTPATLERMIMRKATNHNYPVWCMPVTLRMMLEALVTERKSKSDNIHQRTCRGARGDTDMFMFLKMF
ncbi:cell cycle checkpoint control protein RAD9B isoform X2 [Pangasianodon hypophthalmus]|uniref:cell cycle checkpoint control protein RAD9B isoform X2 n=1 Tax=Pangasianodon hypophthalmus TaxID=310915 RepID=UPI00147E39E1|nr:cell cycle checkpoint control protein RAD9B isoform X2 [Pangasianodon hypophthalmus]